MKTHGAQTLFDKKLFRQVRAVAKYAHANHLGFKTREEQDIAMQLWCDNGLAGRWQRYYSAGLIF